MKFLRLLAGMASAFLLSDGLCAYGQSIFSLEEIFASAEANSVSLKPALTAVREAEMGIREARAAFLPEVEANLSVSFIGDGFTTARNFTDYQKAPIPHLGTQLGINLFQPIYEGGALSTAVDLARLKHISSGYAADLKKDNIRYHLTCFYLDLYRLMNMREVVESNITSANKVLEEMRVRLVQGTVLSNDITRYELLVDNLQLKLIQIDNSIEIINANIVTVAGLPDGTRVIPDPTLLEAAMPLHGEEWWQQEAGINSPSIKLARNGVELSRKSERLTKANMMPKVGINAGWTIDGPILTEVPPINRNLSYWYAGVGLSYNLSSLYKTNKSLHRSRVATRKASDELEETMEAISLAVKADYIRYLESFEELKTREKGVELAEKNYQVISTRYSEGMALITDMLDAADSRLDSQQHLVNARLGIISSYYKLLYTSGKI